MSVVSSALNSAAVTFDFNVEGDCSIGKHLGFVFNPGETILDVKVKVLTPFTGANPLTQFHLQYGSPLFGGGIDTLYQKTLTPGMTFINNFIGYFESGNNPSYLFDSQYKLAFPIGYMGDLGIYFVSDSPITGGSLLAQFTYLKHTL